MNENEQGVDLFNGMLSHLDPILDENMLLVLFTQRVEEMMRDDLGLLLSTLYRLDVEEEKIQHALKSPVTPPAEGIAALIIERQKQRLLTKKKYSG